MLRPRLRKAVQGLKPSLGRGRMGKRPAWFAWEPPVPFEGPSF